MYVDEIFSGLDYRSFPKISVIDNKMQVEEMVLVDNIDLTNLRNWISNGAPNN